MTVMPMSATARPPVVPRPRLELHNHQIDESVAESHRCGMTHLPTGRVCLLPERHAGGCQFTDRRSV
jgi:hypothetical protein